MSFATLKDIYQETSPFHRFLIPQLLIVVTAIELLRPDRTDSLLYVLSALIKIGLVADCISVVTLHVRGLSASNDFLAFLLCQTPLVTGPFAELALVVSVSRSNTPSSTKTFLIGGLYAKLMVIGSFCIMLHATRSIWTATSTMEGQIGDLLLGFSGILVLASAPSIESTFEL
jgi:hypothetical protein